MFRNLLPTSFISVFPPDGTQDSSCFFFTLQQVFLHTPYSAHVLRIYNSFSFLFLLSVFLLSSALSIHLWSCFLLSVSMLFLLLSSVHLFLASSCLFLPFSVYLSFLLPPSYTYLSPSFLLLVSIFLPVSSFSVSIFLLSSSFPPSCISLSSCFPLLTLSSPSDRFRPTKLPTF